MASIEGLFVHPVLSNDDVVMLMENINKKIIATCNNMDHGLNSVLIKYWIKRVINPAANWYCFKNSSSRENNAIIEKVIFMGSLSSSPNASLWRKNTIMLEIHTMRYNAIEKMFMGALIFCKKFLGKIWNIRKNVDEMFWMKDSETKNAVINKKAMNVNHPAKAQQPVLEP